MIPILKGEAEEYFRLHHQHAALEKKMKPLKEKLLQQLVDGAVSPQECVFLLVNRPQNRKQSDWKGYALGLLVKALRSKVKAAAELERIDASWEKSEVPALHVVVNPEYSAPVVSAS